MKQVLKSPFERASKLWGAMSSPPGSLDHETLDAFLRKASEEGLRDEYESPEAVEGFTLQAYRPSSLPVRKPQPLDDDSSSCSDASEFSELFLTQKSILTDKLPWHDLHDLQEGAISIAPSPRMQRTDVPLTKFLPPRDAAAIRRSSVDERSCNVRRLSIDLQVRSSSAPAYVESLSVATIWADLPPQPEFNPFDNVPDTEGYFSKLGMIAEHPSS